MRIEVRNNKVLIDGYVNAVDRYSKPLNSILGKFIEKIVPGCFKRAIEENSNIKVLLNHDQLRELANTENGTAKLFEDNIGLRAIVEIDDPEVVDKAKKGLLKGWSFGFKDKKVNRSKNEEGLYVRDVVDMYLREVSIIDDRKTPAYYGTSIEMRDDDDEVINYRCEEFEERDLYVEEDSKNKQFIERLKKLKGGK